MPVKHALVVDDSRLARHTLGKMLANYKLAVDTAESAEVALEYLSNNKPPHVIFMDHMMPGMDGLQAVQAIKKNPQTAMIPVVMYTSKEGELYMGRARALGAVGVLPKPIRSVELEKIIHILNLDPASSDQTRPEAPAKPNVVAMPLKTTPPPRPSFMEIVRNPAVTMEQDAALLFRRLLEEHRGKLKQDLVASSQDIAERIDAILNRQSPASSGWNALVARYGKAALAAGVALLAGLAVWYAQVENRTGAETAGKAPLRLAASPAGMGKGNTRLMETPRTHLKTGEQNAKSAETIDNLKTQMGNQRRQWLAAIEWAVNFDNNHDFDQIALGDERLPLFSELMSRLAAVDFKGTVRIGVHVGEFCLLRNETGEYRLPPDDAPMENCQTTGLSQEQSAAMGARQSLGFARFLANAPYGNGRINVEVASYGKEKPLHKYPAPYSVRTAGEWNRIARLNNRIEVTITPSTP